MSIIINIMVFFSFRNVNNMLTLFTFLNEKKYHNNNIHKVTFYGPVDIKYQLDKKISILSEV